MYRRRFRAWVGTVRWFAVVSLGWGVAAVALAVTGQELTKVIAAGLFAVSGAILALREE